MDKEIPPGQRFSHVYLRSDTLLPDSKRARMRMLSLARDELGFSSAELGDICRAELGLDGGHAPLNFFQSCEARDFLDLVTIIWRHLKPDREYPDKPERWLKGIRRIFSEESLGYRIDDRAGVHFVIDAEYERNRIAVVSGLGSSRYKAVLHAFEQAHSSLDKHPPDLKGALRLAFDAVETLFKLMYDKAPKIATSEIRNYLLPNVEKIYRDDKIAKRAALKIVDGLIEWVDAVHFYRHAQATEEPLQPPAELAVLMLSEAASYLRWLAALDAFQKNR